MKLQKKNRCFPVKLKMRIDFYTIALSQTDVDSANVLC